jgi:hypothetical protein
MLSELVSGEYGDGRLVDAVTAGWSASIATPKSVTNEMKSIVAKSTVSGRLNIGMLQTQ